MTADDKLGQRPASALEIQESLPVALRFVRMAAERPQRVCGAVASGHLGDARRGGARAL